LLGRPDVPTCQSVLHRSNVWHEVRMFSLIALYFEYRKAQASHALTTVTSVANQVRPANDVGTQVVASAA
jgi:hypothetical protein